MSRKNKQPREVVDFDVDFSRRMADDETIVDAVITYTGPDQELLVPSAEKNDTRVKVWTRAGRDGSTYKVTVLAITSGKRQLEKEFVLQVKDQ